MFHAVEKSLYFIFTSDESMVNIFNRVGESGCPENHGTGSLSCLRVNSNLKAVICLFKSETIDVNSLSRK